MSRRTKRESALELDKKTKKELLAEYKAKIQEAAWKSINDIMKDPDVVSISGYYDSKETVETKFGRTTVYVFSLLNCVYDNGEVEEYEETEVGRLMSSSKHLFYIFKDIIEIGDCCVITKKELSAGKSMFEVDLI